MSSKFYKWLIDQTDRDDPIGDLADDIIGDRDYPTTLSNVEKLVGYLELSGACYEAVEAMESACSEFSALEINS